MLSVYHTDWCDWKYLIVNKNLKYLIFSWKISLPSLDSIFFWLVTHTEGLSLILSIWLVPSQIWMWLPLKDMLCVLAAISFTGILRSHASGREVLGGDTFAATVCPDCAYSLSCSEQCLNCNAVIGSIIQSSVDCSGAAKARCWWHFACRESKEQLVWSFWSQKITLKICKGMSAA